MTRRSACVPGRSAISALNRWGQMDRHSGAGRADRFDLLDANFRVGR